MGRSRRKLKKSHKALESANSLKVRMKSPVKKKGIRMKLKKVIKSETDDESPPSSPGPSSPLPTPSTGNKRKGYGGYSQEDMMSAVRAIKEEGMSIYKAAELYGVPKSTLHDKACGKSNMLFQRKGPAPLLSYDDEKKLVDYLLQMSNLGYLFSIAELRNLASELAVEKGKLCEGMLLSPRWHKSFRTRWPILNEKVFGDFRTCERKAGREEVPRRKTLETFEFEEDGEQIQISTMADDTDICLSNYYTELRVILEKYDLMDKPQRIYCIDEVAIQYESGKPKARQIKSLKHTFPSRSETTVVSLIGCGNALGNSLPPFLIYPGYKLDSDLMKGKYPGVQGVVTENGLTDYTTMKHYLEKHFVEHAMLGMKSRTPPVLVLYDGSKSKISPDTISWAKSHNIILFVLPPSTMNLTYPLEKGCFRTFKDHFIRETRIFREMYNVETISKKAICKIVSEAYPIAMSVKSLVEMFGDIGIFPYKPSIALCDELRNERFVRKKKYNSIKKRPPGMKDKGVQIWIKDDSNIKLIKSGRRRIITQEDPTVTDVDSTMAFLRDKKIQKMLEGNTVLRTHPREESDYSDSDEEFEESIVEMDISADGTEEIHQPSATYHMNGSREVVMGKNRTMSHTVTSTASQYVPQTVVEDNDYKIEETHTYALAPSGIDGVGTQTVSKATVETTDLDTIEQTRVAVQALQDIANDIQYVNTSGLPLNTTVQNVTLNSGRMIQVVVQGPADQVLVSQEGVESVMEAVEQIEIDNSVESIIPMGTTEEEVVDGSEIIQNT